jgi:hypothetical protein
MQLGPRTISGDDTPRPIFMQSRNVPAGKYLSRDPKQGYYILGKTGLRLYRRNLLYTQADFVVGIKQSVH